jgi:hypothetical protein
MAKCMPTNCLKVGRNSGMAKRGRSGRYVGRPAGHAMAKLQRSHLLGGSSAFLRMGLPGLPRETQLFQLGYGSPFTQAFGGIFGQ